MKLALTLALAGAANAQVSSEGHPSMGMTADKWVSPPVSMLPALNSSLVMDYRSKMGHGEKRGGFAVPREVSVNAKTDGIWIGGVWRHSFSANDVITKGLFLNFDEFWLPEGATLFAYTDEGKVAGAFTSANNKQNGQFMIRPLQGKTLTVEYNANGATDAPKLHINTVGSAYSNFPGFSDAEKRGPSQSCNVDSACSDADEWRDEIDAGAILMTNFGGYCSGSMINNEAGKQYFLTAFHCSPSENDIVGFNYAESACGGDDNSIQPDTAQGLTTLAKSSGSDFHLLEVQEAIPSSYGVYLAGWNAEERDTWTDVTGIHHPATDRQKFSQHYGDVTRSGYLTTDGATHWYVDSWQLGTTEGGSSGSPLYNADKEIIGQLHGGYAQCTYNFDDYYGSTAVSYVNGLGEQLAPSGAMSMKGTAL